MDSLTQSAVRALESAMTPDAVKSSDLTPAFYIQDAGHSLLGPWAPWGPLPAGALRLLTPGDTVSPRKRDSPEIVR